MQRPLSPGFRFKDGRLLIFTAKEVMVLSTWPELKALRKPATAKVWRAFEPVFRVLQPRSENVSLPTGHELKTNLGPVNVTPIAIDPDFERLRAFIQWRQALPPEVAVASERFRGQQWRLIRICQKKPPFLDLLKSNPALGFLLAHHEVVCASSGSFNLAATLAQEKQRDLAGWLGFPATDQAVRLLAKLQPEAVDLRQVTALRRTLGQAETVKTLSHLPQFNAGLIALVINPPLAPWVTPKLLLEVANTPEEHRRPTAARLLEDLRTMQAQMEPARNPRQFQSMARLREVHREMSVEYARWRQSGEGPRYCFPTPPLPGEDWIQPLINAAELDEEGQVQSNCVATYAHWVASGEGYVYRVLKPERATLAIERGPGGNWCIQQLSGKANAAVELETERVVTQWLLGHAIGI